VKSTPKRIRYSLNTFEEAEIFADEMRDAGYKDVEVKPLHYHGAHVGFSVYWTEETTD
jgi:hypothetical protein